MGGGQRVIASYSITASAKTDAAKPTVTLAMWAFSTICSHCTVMRRAGLDTDSGVYNTSTAARLRTPRGLPPSVSREVACPSTPPTPAPYTATRSPLQ
jgi:hypothetical protein